MDPAPGPRRPLAATPAAVGRSARRTTSVDITRPDGLLGPVVALLAGRDRAVDAGGAAHDRDAASLAVRATPSGVVQGIDDATASGPAGLADLVGADLRSGFGRCWTAALPADAAGRTVLAALLDELPGALMVSGYALARAGHLTLDAVSGREMAARQADICAGWAVGEPLHDVLAAEGRVAIPSGPPAPPLERADPGGWHALAPLGEGTVRRRRLLEVAPGAAGAGLAVRAHFRDSWTGDGREIALHEYEVEATVDGDGCIARVEVDARVLPWDACPGAVGSASRVVGVHLADLPAHLRAELRGPSTCTHLNSTLRSLTDVAALAGTVAADA